MFVNLMVALQDSFCIDCFLQIVHAHRACSDRLYTLVGIVIALANAGAAAVAVDRLVRQPYHAHLAAVAVVDGLGVGS